MREEIKVKDESSIVENIGVRNRTLKASIPQEESLPKEEEISDELQQYSKTEDALPENKAPQSRKETSKRRRGQAESYDEVFLKRKELKTRQSVYISQEIHASIARLVHLLALAGKEISVGGYIDNVLAEHLESHKDVIAEMSRKQLDQFL